VTVTLHAGDAALTIDPQRGARWTSWRVGDLELLSAPREPLARAFDRGCFVMAPIAGRDGRHSPPAIHGTVADVPWHHDHVGRHALDATAGGDGFTVHQRLRLHPDRLESELGLRAERPLDAWIGHHPYFARRLARGGDAVWRLRGGTQYVRGDDHLPTGELVEPRPGPWDDAFRDFTAPPGIDWPGAVSLTVESSHRHFVLYDEKPEVVCLEPQTAPPDAARLGEAWHLRGGEELLLAVTWRWALARR
jgi:aldose 1-epimerase